MSRNRNRRGRLHRSDHPAQDALEELQSCVLLIPYPLNMICLSWSAADRSDSPAKELHNLENNNAANAPGARPGAGLGHLSAAGRFDSPSTTASDVGSGPSSSIAGACTRKEDGCSVKASPTALLSALTTGLVAPSAGSAQAGKKPNIVHHLGRRHRPVEHQRLLAWA